MTSSSSRSIANRQAKKLFGTLTALGLTCALLVPTAAFAQETTASPTPASTSAVAASTTPSSSSSNTPPASASAATSSAEGSATPSATPIVEEPKYENPPNVKVKIGRIYKSGGGDLTIGDKVRVNGTWSVSRPRAGQQFVVAFPEELALKIGHKFDLTNRDPNHEGEVMARCEVDSLRSFKCSLTGAVTRYVELTDGQWAVDAEVVKGAEKQQLEFPIPGDPAKQPVDIPGTGVIRDNKVPQENKKSGRVLADGASIEWTVELKGALLKSLVGQTPQTPKLTESTLTPSPSGTLPGTATAVSPIVTASASDISATPTVESSAAASPTANRSAVSGESSAASASPVATGSAKTESATVVDRLAAGLEPCRPERNLIEVGTDVYRSDSKGTLKFERISAPYNPNLPADQKVQQDGWYHMTIMPSKPFDSDAMYRIRYTTCTSDGKRLEPGTEYKNEVQAKDDIIRTPGILPITVPEGSRSSKFGTLLEANRFDRARWTFQVNGKDIAEARAISIIDRMSENQTVTGPDGKFAMKITRTPKMPSYDAATQSFTRPTEDITARVLGSSTDFRDISLIRGVDANSFPLAPLTIDEDNHGFKALLLPVKPIYAQPATPAKPVATGSSSAPVSTPSGDASATLTPANPASITKTASVTPSPLLLGYELDLDLFSAEFDYTITYENDVDLKKTTEIQNNAVLNGMELQAMDKLREPTERKSGYVNQGPRTVAGITHPKRTTIDWNISIHGKLLEEHMKKLQETARPDNALFVITDEMSKNQKICDGSNANASLQERLGLQFWAADAIWAGGYPTQNFDAALVDVAVDPNNPQKLLFTVDANKLPKTEFKRGDKDISIQHFSREYRYELQYTTCTSSGKIDASGTSYSNEAVLTGSTQKREVVSRYSASGDITGITGGSFELTKQLAGDELPADDERTFVVQVEEFAPVREADGTERPLTDDELDDATPAGSYLLSLRPGEAQTGELSLGNNWTVRLSERVDDPRNQVSGFNFKPEFTTAENVRLDKHGNAIVTIEQDANIQVTLTNIVTNEQQPTPSPTPGKPKLTDKKDKPGLPATGGSPAGAMALLLTLTTGGSILLASSARRRR